MTGDEPAPTTDELARAEQVAARNRRICDGFDDVVSRVPSDGWDAPTPCEGWVARDIVAHLVEWMPGLFFGVWDVAAPPGPDVATDPRGAWVSLRYQLQAVLDDPAMATRTRDSPFGRATLADAYAIAGLADILIHTWDLGRAIDRDVALDTAEIDAMAAQITTVDDAAMRASGHFGPAVPVDAGASAQDRVLAWFGRDPDWSPPG